MVSRTSQCFVVSVVLCFILFVALSGDRAVFQGNDSLNIANIGFASEANGPQAEQSKSEEEVDFIL